MRPFLLLLLMLSPLRAAEFEAPPPDFPRFSIANHDEESRLLTNYLWYHFRTRLGHGTALFNQEYLATSDLWMGGAMHPGWKQPVQSIYRDDLLHIRLDADGYVWTNQHFSHAHEFGWPFPLWTSTPAGEKGYAAGWHFQDDGPGWVWQYSLRKKPDSPFGRAKATEGWTLLHVRSLGIDQKKWQLEATGASPAIETPSSVTIDAFNAPFLQLRWTRDPKPSPGAPLPYVEWQREGDAGYSPERRVYFELGGGNPDYEAISGAQHSMMAMYRHPQWQGRIKRVRIQLAPGEAGGRFAIDSFFTAYDTRHTINNPIYILACWSYYRWTGDIGLLRTVINRMRTALRYQQQEMGGLEFNHIRNRWPGHDGLAGYTVNPDGTKTMHYGHGIGNNYWDLMPFGWDDLYATSQYYASLLAMAEVEEAVRSHPEWGVPEGALALDPARLRAHAAEVKRIANRKFWDPKAGRFVACIDKNGVAHDYGYTFLNLDAIWYGLATPEHSQAIMDWLGGKRTVEGDTSTGADIYHWRFGPRASTRRNLDWYFFGWTGPEKIPWGGQVQDGGAVLGFSFYDLWGYLNVQGPDAAWSRLKELLAWEREVQAGGGYRAYYAGGKRGTTLQGGNTAGGIGIDAEFFESSLVPSILIHGFLGLRPDADVLTIAPRLPSDWPSLTLDNLFYRGANLNVKATNGEVELTLNAAPPQPIEVRLGAQGAITTIVQAGTYRLAR